MDLDRDQAADAPLLRARKRPRRIVKVAPLGAEPQAQEAGRERRDRRGEIPEVHAPQQADRARVQGTAEKDQLHRDVLKGIRWLLLKNPENLTKSDAVDERSRLQEALQLNQPLAVAYYLKDELRQFWKQSSKCAAEKFLEDWCRRADATDIHQLHTMSKTLKAHRTGLLNWYDEPISTGPLEGINNKIGALQRRAYGFRNYEHLKQRLLTLHHTRFVITG